MINRGPSPSGNFAVICQSLYLANLLLLPGIFFLVLLYYYLQYQQHKLQDGVVEVQVDNNKIRIRNLGIGKVHLIRSLQLSVLAGILLALVPLIVIYFSSQLKSSIMVGLIYFITLHTGFILIGMLNLSRAMAKKLPLF
ncbi:hypothetical protein [Colwellia psychrerythraea]|uniref:Uncharacterized protein n=1 Tax=Colwellia psychrerythraea (strain 34H / ATCC BAA-681) TaxID=167879 RepID=Q482H5_COLP3|nr:hypothetical protein [Colwellia psychrerythraea]AAZ28802.1 hypothetical protein CPS_2322 [Colwellia psychrerythraea 34H]